MDMVQDSMAWEIMIAAGLNAVVAAFEKEKSHHCPSAWDEEWWFGIWVK